MGTPPAPEPDFAGEAHHVSVAWRARPAIDFLFKVQAMEEDDALRYLADLGDLELLQLATSCACLLEQVEVIRRCLLTVLQEYRGVHFRAIRFERQGASDADLLSQLLRDLDGESSP